MSDIEKPHHAYVMGIIGDPYLWVVKCDRCPWLSQAIGPWVDGKEADRQAEAHSTDPDIERKAAEYAELWDRPDYDLLDDEQLQAHVDEWFVRHHEFARLREEAGDSGEGDRYRRWGWDAHVRATQGIREQRRRENRVLRALEQERNSQCEEGGEK